MKGSAMQATVLYESMFGATHAIADAVGEGLSDVVPTRVLSIHDERSTEFGELLVVGAPTHARSLPSPSSRHEGAGWPKRPGDHRLLEADAESPGIREWLDGLRLPGTAFAAFSTRADANAFLVGTAAKSIDRRLRAAGGRSIAPLEAFLVDGDGRLVDGELDRARRWGRTLSTALSPVP
ncbi:MAG: flavodoxin family protein [Actinomycetota bacterium]|nr:flavodoxin family protein [Actinomycetota bacterium]